MPNKIKLENILLAGFDSDTGDAFINITEEYVCENCRHLVDKNDKFCWQCGEELKQSKLIEHYYEGKKLTERNFQKEVLHLYQ